MRSAEETAARKLSSRSMTCRELEDYLLGKGYDPAETLAHESVHAARTWTIRGSVWNTSDTRSGRTAARTVHLQN